jgi:hypothetical protein
VTRSTRHSKQNADKCVQGSIWLVSENCMTEDINTDFLLPVSLSQSWRVPSIGPELSVRRCCFFAVHVTFHCTRCHVPSVLETVPRFKTTALLFLLLSDYIILLLLLLLLLLLFVFYALSHLKHKILHTAGKQISFHPQAKHRRLARRARHTKLKRSAKNAS